MLASALLRKYYLRIAGDLVLAVYLPALFRQALMAKFCAVRIIFPNYGITAKFPGPKYDFYSLAWNMAAPKPIAKQKSLSIKKSVDERAGHAAWIEESIRQKTRNR